MRKQFFLTVLSFLLFFAPFLAFSQEKVHEIVDVQTVPDFPGGDDSMTSFIIRTVKYPAEAVANDAYGKVYVQFIVEKDGSLSGVRVKEFVEKSTPPKKKKKVAAYRNACEALKSEACRVIHEMPSWSPGTQNGAPVRVYILLPILFSLK